MRLGINSKSRAWSLGGAGGGFLARALRADGCEGLEDGIMDGSVIVRAP